MGHEGAGVIAQVGPEVTPHKIGDKSGMGMGYGTALPLVTFYHRY
jgi:D-arabinose 1-dehydrogenase-like Zn-dependent alcohol dehydrogenase